MTIKQEIVGSRVHLINLLCMCIVWLSSSFGYYLIGYDLKYIRGDIYINGLVSSSSECVATLVAGYCLEKVGVKMTLVFSYLTALVGMLCLIITSTDEEGWLSLFILGSKFGISAAFVVAYCGNYYLFPVSIVATTMGICQIGARISTIFAPYVAEIPPNSFSQWIFCIVISTAFLASLAIVDEKRLKKNDD